jgi:molybdenum cofactor guanylyltransferase
MNLVSESDSKGTCSLAAALLAGGASRRMGSDKALLPVEFEGKTCLLWEKQWRLLKAVAPAELLFSGPSRAALPPEVPALRDRWESAGPLAGIATCLEYVRSDLLLVLAVDLPLMNLICLSELIRLALGAKSGVVPVLNGKFEPLVAIYPKGALPIAFERIERQQLKLQEFVLELQAKQIVLPWIVPLEMSPCFNNWNHPEEISRNAL